MYDFQPLSLAKTTLAIILSLIFLCLSAIHFYWVIGGKWGLDKALPTNPDGKKSFEPGILPTAIVGLGLLSFAVLYLAKSGFLDLPIPQRFINYATWFIPGIFILRAIGDFKYVGLFKKIKDTDFGKTDTKLFVPLCFVIGLLGFLTMILPT